MTWKSQRKILIVDDDTSHRTMMRNLLSELGYAIFEVDDGYTAIENVREQVFDVIIIDADLAGASGCGVLNRIKSIYPSIPIIVVKPHSSLKTSRENSDNQIYAFLTKPLDFDALYMTIEQAMNSICLPNQLSHKTWRASIMKCPKCQKENREEAQFCLECGERLVLMCHRCDNILLLTAKFCDKCGQKYKEYEESVRDIWPDSGTYRAAKAQFEKAFLVKKLDEFKWNISKTADAIGIERSNLHKKIKRWGLKPP